MIRIQSKQVRSIVSHLDSQSAILSSLTERMADLIRQVKLQDYTDEVLAELYVNQKRLMKLLYEYRELSKSLEKICEIIDETEKRVIHIYEDEEIVQLQPVILKEMNISINPNLKSIAKIVLKNERKNNE